MRDFTHDCYKNFLRRLRTGGLVSRLFREGFSSEAARSVILRHDVDRLPKRALALAQVETDAGFPATYFMRTKPHCFNPLIIAAIRDMGHEIGYHYETLADARGDPIRAWDLFRRELDKIRTIAPVTAIAMHGRPFSPWDGRDLWQSYDYKSLGIACEAYLDVDWSQARYFTDTGRAWNGSGNRRDRPPTIVNMAPFSSTQALADYLLTTGGWAVISTHPERWTAALPTWLQVLVTDSAINAVKSLSR
jgi:hypothetical protein